MGKSTVGAQELGGCQGAWNEGSRRGKGGGVAHGSDGGESREK